MIVKVKDNGWNDGVTFVEVNTDNINRGDYYLSDGKKHKSIELCDSEDLAIYVNKKSKKYKKIIKASQEIDKGCCGLSNKNVIIDCELNEK